MQKKNLILFFIILMIFPVFSGNSAVLAEVFPISALDEWTSTVDINTGDFITITLTGQWDHDSTGDIWEVADLPPMGLISETAPLACTHDDETYPKNLPGYLNITGANYGEYAAVSGTLYLGPGDYGGNWDNRGTISADISVNPTYWYETYDFSAKGVSAYWPMDENANDYSGNNLHGTALHSNLTSGYFNQCYNFIGVDGSSSSRIEVPDYPHSSGVTYAAWIYLDQYASGSTYELSSTLFFRRAHYADQSIHIFPDGTIGFFNLRGSYIPSNNAVSTETVPVGEWHHVAVTMDSQYTRIYLDGMLVADEPSAGAIYWTGSYYITSIGIHSDGGSWWHPFDGKIDEMTIFNYALSPEQVANLASDVNSNDIADFWEDTEPATFSENVRAVPHDEAIYLEWEAADDVVGSISYNIYLSTTSGGQNFDVPYATTADTGILVEGLENGTTYYIVVRAMASLVYETENTNEIVCIPGSNMMAGAMYNHDFEAGTGTRGPVLGKPAGWSASGQDYGEKFTIFQVDDTEPYEGTYCALVETLGTPANPDDLSIASLINDQPVSLLKDHTYAVSIAVRRNQSQWTRLSLFSYGYSLIHTESFDAGDDGVGDSGWERLYFHYRPPIDLEAFLQIDSLVANARTGSGETCKLWADDVQIVDLGIETIVDVYDGTPSELQYGIRNRYFDRGTETEVATFGGTVYSCTDMPVRWNMAFARDGSGNDAPGYPVWGQSEPPGFNTITGEAIYLKARGNDAGKPAWPALAADGVLISTDDYNGQRHVLSFDYGVTGQTPPFLRVFAINGDFSHYASLFVSSAVNIPADRIWPLTLQYTPAFSESLILVRFDNVTIGPLGNPHTIETTMYVDNVVLGVLQDNVVGIIIL